MTIREIDVSNFLAEAHRIADGVIEAKVVTSTDMYAWNRLQARMIIMARKAGLLPPIKHKRISRRRVEVIQRRKARTGSVWRQ